MVPHDFGNMVSSQARDAGRQRDRREQTVDRVRTDRVDADEPEPPVQRGTCTRCGAEVPDTMLLLAEGGPICVSCEADADLARYEAGAVRRAWGAVALLGVLSVVMVVGLAWTLWSYPPVIDFSGEVWMERRAAFVWFGAALLTLGLGLYEAGRGLLGIRHAIRAKEAAAVLIADIAILALGGLTTASTLVLPGLALLL